MSQVVPNVYLIAHQNGKVIVRSPTAPIFNGGFEHEQPHVTWPYPHASAFPTWAGAATKQHSMEPLIPLKAKRNYVLLQVIEGGLK